jgi:cytochrome P450
MKRIEERRKGRGSEKPASEGPVDMLTKFFEGHEEDPEKFTAQDVLMGAYGNIIAGADTTWISLNAILYNLLKNPGSLIKLQHEIDTKARNGEISNPITWKEAKTMPYLQAVIREGQRLFPAAGFPLWRNIPEGGATLCGRFFPAGVGIPNSPLNTPSLTPHPDDCRYKQLGRPPQPRSLRSGP